MRGFAVAAMLIVLVFTTGCEISGTVSSTPEGPRTNPYPGQAPTSPAILRPTHTPPAVVVSGNPFGIAVPLLEGATEIRGKGPRDLPIVVMDITYNGQEIAKSVISSDGSFVASVDPPLERGHRIGITVGPLEKSVAENESFLQQLYDRRGPGYVYVPTLAYFYDSALVQAK